jgi:hypothetical protein
LPFVREPIHPVNDAQGVESVTGQQILHRTGRSRLSESTCFDSKLDALNDFHCSVSASRAAHSVGNVLLKKQTEWVDQLIAAFEAFQRERLCAGGNEGQADSLGPGAENPASATKVQTLSCHKNWAESCSD